MEYKQYINQVLDLKDDILIQEQKVVELESRCNNVTSSFSERVQTSPKNTKEINIVRLADARQQLKTLYEELDDLEKELTNFLVNSLSRQDASVMRLKYINGKENWEIANIRYLTVGSVRNIIYKANMRAKIAYERRSK